MSHPASLPPVPLCDLAAQLKPIQSEIEQAVLRVIASGQVINGPEVDGLEREVAEYSRAAFGVGCSSGSDALLLALAALDIGPGDEVIIPPFTFFATLGAVVRIGATPVFADIDPETYNIDPLQIEAKITPKTKAIIPVHLYGQCAEMGPIQELASRYNIAIVEDSAQAIGAEYHGHRTGQLGVMSCLSFYPSKNLGTYGDAGLVTTSDPDLAKKLKALRNHGSEIKYFHKYMGWNGRVDAIHAAILRVKLPHLDRWVEGRQAAAKRYDGLIESRGLDALLKRPVVRPGMRHVFNQYVLRVPTARRDGLIAHLKQNQIGCEIYYPLSLHLQECIRHLGYREGDYPVSEEASKSVIALPMFPEITAGQQERVVDAVSGYLHSDAALAAA
jgi:dTDP-4-amino-4,6-dideoxygalactose transaminase